MCLLDFVTIAAAICFCFRDGAESAVRPCVHGPQALPAHSEINVEAGSLYTEHHGIASSIQLNSFHPSFTSAVEAVVSPLTFQ